MKKEETSKRHLNKILCSNEAVAILVKETKRLPQSHLLIGVGVLKPEGKVALK
jgi:hypothetical protein